MILCHVTVYIITPVYMYMYRYHYYSESLSDPNGPVTHRSEDLRQLENEIELAEEQLANSKQLYEECSRLKKVGKCTLMCVRFTCDFNMNCKVLSQL